jgi:hypothetical protein
MAKAQLVATPDIKTEQTTAAKSASKSASKTKRALDLDSIVSPSEAALEKRRANEGRNVEHVPVE